MRHDEEEPILSESDARFLRELEAVYRPPAATAAARTRFAAGLEARIARERRRPRWLLGGALAAAAVAAVLALVPGGEPRPEASDGAAALHADASVSSGEVLLVIANGPLADPDEALPEDYQMLASLLE